MKVYQVLEFYADGGLGQVDDYVYSTQEQAEARLAEVRKQDTGQYYIFELEVKSNAQSSL